MALKENTTHVVVNFCGETTKYNKRSVDLVVRSWLFYIEANAMWICRYPTPENLVHINKWVQDCIPPKKDFLEYEVDIIKEASSYSHGSIYWNQSFTNAEIKSIDGDMEYDSNDPENPKIYSQREATKILNESKRLKKKKIPQANNGRSELKSITTRNPIQQNSHNTDIIDSIDNGRKIFTKAYNPAQSVSDVPRRLKKTIANLSSESNKDIINNRRQISSRTSSDTHFEMSPRENEEIINSSLADSDDTDIISSSNFEETNSRSIMSESSESDKGFKNGNKNVINETISDNEQPCTTINNKNTGAVKKHVQTIVSRSQPVADTRSTPSHSQTTGKTRVTPTYSQTTHRIRMISSQSQLTTAGKTIIIPSHSQITNKTRTPQSRSHRTDKPSTTPSRSQTTDETISNRTTETPNQRMVPNGFETRLSPTRHFNNHPADRNNREKDVIYVTLEDLRAMEKRIETKISSAKRSILYNISKIYRVVKSAAVVRNEQISDQQASSINTLDMKFPLENIDEFENFDTKLLDPENKKTMKTYMLLFACGSTPEEDIASILPEIIRKSIQLLHSGCGRIVKGVGKRNFSVTVVYSCMEDILIRKYAGKTTPKQIRSFTGIWLARSGDREGGKAERTVKAAGGGT